jgi:hypothetical protein
MTSEQFEAVSDNTISFNHDLTVLYLIDSGRAIPYALNKRSGVLVTVLRGQITVVSAPDLQSDKALALAAASEERVVIPDPVGDTALPPFPQNLSVPVRGNNWTLFYNTDHQVLGIIGALDIDGAIKEGRRPGTQVSLFPLANRILNLRRAGDRLELRSIRLT